MNELDPYKPPAEPVAPPPAARAEPMPFHASFTPIEALGKALAIMLLLYGAIQVFEAISYTLQAELLLRMQAHESFTHDEATQNDARVTALAAAGVAVFLATAAVFGTFLVRANRNARAFGAVGMQYTPGWSVGYFFVPFANLIVPYRAVSEIWKASTLDTTSWKLETVPSYFAFWWITWVVGNVTGRIASSMSTGAGTESLVAGSIVSVVSAATMAIASVLAARMVGEIRKRQNARAGR